jgi:hypothetical protein
MSLRSCCTSVIIVFSITISRNAAVLILIIIYTLVHLSLSKLFKLLLAIYWFCMRCSWCATLQGLFTLSSWRSYSVSYFTLVFCSACSTMKTETVCSSEKSADFQRSRLRYIPKSSILQHNLWLTLCNLASVITIIRNSGFGQCVLRTSRPWLKTAKKRFRKHVYSSGSPTFHPTFTVTPKYDR